MPAMSLAQVIQLPDRRRLVLLQQDRDLMLFFHSHTDRLNLIDSNNLAEYWKCVHRVCSLRICTRGSSFQILPEHGRHNHASTSATLSFLRRNQYQVEKVLFQNKMRPYDRSQRITCMPTSSQVPVNVDRPGNNGAVLKQLLLSGKLEDSQLRSNKIIHHPSLTDRMPLSGQSSGIGDVKRIPEVSMPITSLVSNAQSVDLRHQQLGIPIAKKMWEVEQQMERWSPPILNPPPPGGPYSPPPTPVARIEPYVEPQVMYNPYFLWQLYSYKQTCKITHSHLLSMHQLSC